MPARYYANAYIRTPLNFVSLMAKITQFSLQQFRNLNHVQLSLSPKLNLIVGDNAAGKTAIIEGIWVLSTGRSFRTNQPKHLIQQDQTEFTLFSQVKQQAQTHKLGLSRSEHSSTLKLNGNNLHNQSELANKLPVQLLTPESHRLLEEGPKARRHFLNWGCFHHAPKFTPLWRHYQRILKQRNHALRQKLPQPQSTLWDKQLVEVAEDIHQIRQSYVEQITPYLIEFCTALMPEITADIAIHYRSGWPKQSGKPKQTQSLANLLAANYAKDYQQGFTQYGCHRADLRFGIGSQEASLKLSRGQQKLFVCALLLAQASLYEKISKEPVIMLIDDLPAELDEHHRLTLLKLLDCLNIQHIITTTSSSLIPILSPETANIYKITLGEVCLY